MKPLKLSKKINIFAVIFLLLIGITIGGYLVLKSKIGTASISEQLSQILEQSKKTVASCQPNPDDKNKDSDNDGLMDWQETTWQTDPCKPDTDGDGYLDGEEVASGYNPTIPAPNDELSGQNPTIPRSMPHNLTQALAGSLREKITNQEMESISDALDPSSISTSNRIVNTAIQQVISQSMEEFSLPHIPDEEIIISADNSQAAIRFYAGKIVEAIEQWEIQSSIDQGNLFESESELFYYAIQNKDFTEIDKYIRFYQGAAEEFKQIPVPADLKDIHKEQIGIFWVTANIFRAIKQIDQDPLKTNLALEQYKATTDLFNQMFLKLTDYLERHP